MTPVSLYITAANREEAISISHELLSLRLIACANIIDHATSLYWWQGSIERESESLIIAKTLSIHTHAVIEKVKQLHSYRVPCITVSQIVDGNADFLKWLREKVTPAAA